MIIRGLFATSLLIWVVALDGLLPMFFLIVFSVLLLFFHGFKWAYLLKSLRLLLWLVVPILIIHGLFTPGRLILSPIYMPLSVEGLERGLYLSAHITLIFFCAMLAFRLFSKQEWFNLVHKISKSGQLKIYIVLLISVKYGVTHILQQTKRTWSEQGKSWQRFVQLIADGVQQVLQSAKSEAKYLWLYWDERMLIPSEISIPLWSKKDSLYIFILLVGWGLFWLI